MDIGRRVYYDKATGNILLDTGEKSGDVVNTTIEQDFNAYNVLLTRNLSTVDVVELAYGQFAEDFRQMSGYSVDVSTGNIVFSYPDPSTPDAPPVYRKPLTEQIAEQNVRLQDLELTIASMMGL